MQRESKKCNGLVPAPPGTIWPPPWLITPLTPPQIAAEPTPPERKTDKSPWDPATADALICDVQAARLQFGRFGWPAASEDCRRLGVLFDSIDRAHLTGDLASLRQAVALTLTAIGTMLGTVLPVAQGELYSPAQENERGRYDGSNH